MMKKTLLVALVTLMSFSAMAGSDLTFRKGSNQTSFGALSLTDNDYTRRSGFLLHLGANNGLGAGVGYQFSPFFQAYGEAGISGFTVGGRFYANEQKWSFMADLALGMANVLEYSNGEIVSTKGFGVKGIAGASYKAFDFGAGAWFANGRFYLAVMAEWNIRFGRD